MQNRDRLKVPMDYDKIQKGIKKLSNQSGFVRMIELENEEGERKEVYFVELREGRKKWVWRDYRVEVCDGWLKRFWSVEWASNEALCVMGRKGFYPYE